jgi:hypothetical protein
VELGIEVVAAGTLDALHADIEPPAVEELDKPLPTIGIEESVSSSFSQPMVASIEEPKVAAYNHSQFVVVGIVELVVVIAHIAAVSIKPSDCNLSIALASFALVTVIGTELTVIVTSALGVATGIKPSSAIAFVPTFAVAFTAFDFDTVVPFIFASAPTFTISIIASFVPAFVVIIVSFVVAFILAFIITFVAITAAFIVTSALTTTIIIVEAFAVASILAVVIVVASSVVAFVLTFIVTSAVSFAPFVVAIVTTSSVIIILTVAAIATLRFGSLTTTTTMASFVAFVIATTFSIVTFALAFAVASTAASFTTLTTSDTFKNYQAFVIVSNPFHLDRHRLLLHLVFI